jgi:hypothetical protein
MERPIVDQQDIILAEMRARIQVIRNLPSGEPINTPFAFVVGKCDVWLQLLNGKTLPEPLHDGKLDTAALEENSNVIRELLHSLCPAVVANAEALSNNVMFFYVSSFGHTPLKIGPGEYVPDPAKLRPVHVEVPLLWILSQVCPSLIRTSDPVVPQASV